MNQRLIAARIAGTHPDGNLVWLTVNDHWTRNPQEAELIDDEAHGDIRLIEAQIVAKDIQDIRFVAAAEIGLLAS